MVPSTSDSDALECACLALVGLSNTAPALRSVSAAEESSTFKLTEPEAELEARQLVCSDANAESVLAPLRLDRASGVQTSGRANNPLKRARASDATLHSGVLDCLSPCLSSQIPDDHHHGDDSEGVCDRDESGTLSQHKKKTKLSVVAARELKSWLLSPEHVDYPYPTDEEKQMLAETCGISIKQLNNWFTNGRKRIWRPLRRRMGCPIVPYTQALAVQHTNNVAPMTSCETSTQATGCVVRASQTTQLTNTPVGGPMTRQPLATPLASVVSEQASYVYDQLMKHREELCRQVRDVEQRLAYILNAAAAVVVRDATGPSFM